MSGCFPTHDCSCEFCKTSIFSKSIGNILSINDFNGERKKSYDEAINIIQKDIERLKIKYSKLKNELLKRIDKLESNLKHAIK